MPVTTNFRPSSRSRFGLAIRTYGGEIVGGIVILALLAVATRHLDTNPPLWWDEGWTLSVARNWVEQGHYGMLLDRVPRTPGLSAGFPTVAMVALSFRLLGVGAWQGRLSSLAVTGGALLCLWYLTCRLYDRKVAIAALVVALFLAPDPGLHPIFIGRQVLAEMPMLLFLLAGYIAFQWTQAKVWFLPFVIGFWGIALIAKAQVLPFWVISLSSMFVFALLKHRVRLTVLTGISALGSFALSQVFSWLQATLLFQGQIAVVPLAGLYETTALAPGSLLRDRVLFYIAIFGWPLAAGLCLATWRQVIRRDDTAALFEREGVRIAFLALVSSWFIWYVFLSIGWERYLFPPFFLGSLFVALLLRDLTHQFDFRWTIMRAGAAIRNARFDLQSAGSLFAIFLIAAMLTFGTTTWQFLTAPDADGLATMQVANFLNNFTASDALIETYESELFFLVDRRYHYPPDQIHVELNRRTFLGQDVPIAYDPLAANPDYLVIGPSGREWRLYEPALTSGALRLIQSYNQYSIYERVR